MEKIIIAFFFFCSISIFGQSKSESENWIVEKHNEYKCSNNPNMDLWFENGYLYYYWTIDDERDAETRNAVVYKIKLKDIKAIKTIKMKYNSEDKIGWTRIILYADKTKILSKYQPEANTFSSTNENFVNIPLNTEFTDEGVNIRFQKAVLHLVKLYGGNAVLKKEAF